MSEPLAPRRLTEIIDIGANPIDGDPPYKDGDLLYLRDFTRPDLMDDDQLEQMAAVCRHCYGTLDIARHCLVALEARKCRTS